MLKYIEIAMHIEKIKNIYTLERRAYLILSGLVCGMEWNRRGRASYPPIRYSAGTRSRNRRRVQMTSKKLKRNHARCIDDPTCQPILG